MSRKPPKIRTLPARITTLKPAMPSKRRHGARRPMNRRDIEQRRKYLRMHPLCCVCTSLGLVGTATACDHIMPLAAGGADVWTNFQALCDEHHIEKTNRDARGEHQSIRYPQRPEDDVTFA